MKKEVLDKKQAKIIVNRFKKNTYRAAVKLFVIFGLIAVVAAFIGSAIDNHFGIKPYASFGMLFVSYIGTWVYIFYFMRTIKKYNKDEKNNQNIEN